MAVSNIARRLTSGTSGRLALGLGANLVGKFWVAIAQIVTIPLLTHYWGLERYGIWLMVTTIPTYLMLSDMGLGAAGAVEMAKAEARADPVYAKGVFRTVWAMVTAISVSLLLIFNCGIHIAASHGVASLQGGEVAAAAFYMSASALFSLQASVLNSGFRSVGAYAQGTFINDLAMPVSTAALVGVVVTGGGLVAAAMAMAICRLAFLPLLAFLLRRRSSHLALGLKGASWAHLRPLLRPAVASLGLTISQAITIQGVLLAVGFSLGPAAAGVFGAARTVARVPLQVSGLFSRASAAEITLAFSQGRDRELRRLMLASVGVSLLVAVPAAAILIFGGEKLLAALVRSGQSPSTAVIAGMAVGMVAEAAFNALAQNSAARNQHHLLSRISFSSAVGSLVVAACLPSLNIIAWALAGVQIASVMVSMVSEFGAIRSQRPDTFRA